MQKNASQHTGFYSSRYMQLEKMDVYLVNKNGFGFLYSSQNRTDQSDLYIMEMMNVLVT